VAAKKKKVKVEEQIVDPKSMEILLYELNKQIDIEDEVTKAEASLKDAKARLHKQNTEAVPTAMAVAEMSKFTMKNGYAVEVKPFVEGKIDKETPGSEEEAYEVMRTYGEDSLIKYTVKLLFGKDEEWRARRFLQVIESGITFYDAPMYGEDGALMLDEDDKVITQTQHETFDAEVSLGVHSASLKAMLKRNFNKEDFPLQTVFGGSAGSKCHIKRPKKSTKS